MEDNRDITHTNAVIFNVCVFLFQVSIQEVSMPEVDRQDSHHQGNNDSKTKQQTKGKVS